jgi:hypothetical protein
MALRFQPLILEFVKNVSQDAEVRF